MFKAKLIFILLLVFCLTACDNSNEHEDTWSHRNIEENLILLESEPMNCFILDEVAAGYQLQNQLQTAITYFEKLMEICPEDFSSRFQLGICYLLVNELNKATVAMDRAILDAKIKGDLQWAKVFENEKRLWLKSIEGSVGVAPR